MASKTQVGRKPEEWYTSPERYYEPPDYSEEEALIAEERKAGEALQRAEIDRALAEARMRLGYQQSAGYGTGGAWEARRAGIERAGLGYITTMQHGWNKFEAAEKLKILAREDMQAFQFELARYNADLQKELAKYMAELNDPAWWEQLGSIVGLGMGIFSPYFGDWFGWNKQPVKGNRS